MPLAEKVREARQSQYGVAGKLGSRACDTEGNAVTPAEANIIAERFTVTEETRMRRRSKRRAGKALQKVLAGHSKLSARGASERSDLPHRQSSRDRRQTVKTLA